MARNNSPLRLSLGGNTRERVEVLAHHTAASDGWLHAEVAIQVGGFSGRFDAYFRVEELMRFRDEVGELYRKLEGVACLNTLEGQLTLRLTVDRLGHVAVSGTAMDVAGTGNRLHFGLAIDQTYLPEVLSQLDALSQS